jgi:soluble lytic murein transglycosylase-like protein
VPFVESGYRNIDAGEHGAGLWQFVKPTAQKYGLKISPQGDERMNPVLEAAAAAHLLADLRQRFGDWPLALAAYTQGGERVQRVLDREGTRDAWELIRRGALDPYPAKVMAAVLVIADPSLAGL